MSEWLRPFEPSAACPWDAAAAAHLLRRAGFAPSETELRSALDAGPQATVAQLVDSSEDSLRHRELDDTGASLAIRDNIGALRGWWLLRLCHTKRPLHARMALFWHNHFATSNDKVRSAALMLQHLRTLERHALGRFEDLLAAIARDPAMIVWLDNNQNVKGRPNENFARELFELFTLGVGQYTEADIKEAARAFTGWHTRGGQFYFSKLEHDDGEKTTLGLSGRLDGVDVIRAALQRPACTRFLAAKLLREFLCPDPPGDLTDAVATRLRETSFDFAATLRTVLGSAAMFDSRWYRTRIKSPVELAVGIVRSMELRVPAEPLAEAVSQMGQRLFEPPSVKGWDGHRAWLNSATMLVRLNAAARAIELCKPAELCARYDVDGRDAALALCERLTLDGRVPDALRGRYAAGGGSVDEAMRLAFRTLLASPEYQMA